MTKDDIYRAFYDTSINKAFLHSHSYTGNPLACSAALATLDIFKDDDVLQSNLALSSQITQALKPIAQEKNVHQFRNQGMIWAFDVEIDEPSLRGSFARRFFAKALEHELLVRPIGHTVYLMPPYILSDSEVGLMAERLQMVYHEVMQVNL
jgi:adenosylmethionine-8-amino-7-oxononanoate aminotransferase